MYAWGEGRGEGRAQSNRGERPPSNSGSDLRSIDLTRQEQERMLREIVRNLVLSQSEHVG